MRLEVLAACMDNDSDGLAERSHLRGDVLIVDQCGRDGQREYSGEKGTVRIIYSSQRGLSLSRNMALDKAKGDICLLCDDDEVFLPGYEDRILRAYESLPQADVLIFKMAGRRPSLPDRAMPLIFPLTLRVSSWQISFKRERVQEAGLRFDPLLGAGSGNGPGEELAFLLECQRAGLRIWYAPVEIATVAQERSTWFFGFTQGFFEDRGAATRYILGPVPAGAYALYYLAAKRRLYKNEISTARAFRAIFRGIREDRIGRQARAADEGA